MGRLRSIPQADTGSGQELGLDDRIGIAMRAALPILVLAYLLAVPFGLISGRNRLGAAEIALLATVFLAVIIIADPRYSLRTFSVSASGVSAQFDRIERRQDELESDVRVLQVLIGGLVTKYELVHLEKISGDDPVSVRFSHKMVEELEHLDAMQFVFPLNSRGLNAMEEDHGSGVDNFDLKEYVGITSEGREYIRLRRNLLARHPASSSR